MLVAKAIHPVYISVTLSLAEQWARKPGTLSATYWHVVFRVRCKPSTASASYTRTSAAALKVLAVVCRDAIDLGGAAAAAMRCPDPGLGHRHHHCGERAGAAVQGMTQTLLATSSMPAQAGGHGCFKLLSNLWKAGRQSVLGCGHGRACFKAWGA